MFSVALPAVPTQCFVSSIEPQFETWIGTGAMKSLSCALGPEPEERVLTKVEPNALQVSGAKTPGTADRLIDASPNVPAPTVPPAIASVNDVPTLTPASAKPAAERSC